MSWHLHRPCRDAAVFSVHWRRDFCTVVSCPCGCGEVWCWGLWATRGKAACGLQCSAEPRAEARQGWEVPSPLAASHAALPCSSMPPRLHPILPQPQYLESCPRPFALQSPLQNPPQPHRLKVCKSSKGKVNGFGNLITSGHFCSAAVSMLAQHCNCFCSPRAASPTVKCCPAPPGSKVVDRYLAMWEMSYLQAAECRGHPVQGVKGMYLDNGTGEHAVWPGGAAHISVGAFVHCWETFERGCTRMGAARGGRVRECSWKSFLAFQGGTFPHCVQETSLHSQWQFSPKQREVPPIPQGIFLQVWGK